ncbi:MAG: heavy-metal-associated domain-containing protein [Ignavibacteria bacterium]|nr:heavy-metal-associated domain-containing protein [Ignavibacteria bacterium]
MKLSIKEMLRTFLVLTLVFSFSAFIAQAEIVKIKTNAHCDACKKTIESGLKKIDGVQKVNVNLKDKVASVQFENKKINAEKIRSEIVKLGYEADEVKAATSKSDCTEKDPAIKCKDGSDCKDKKSDAGKAPSTKTISPKIEKKNK